MERPSTVTSVSPKDSSSARRSGFTLVELLAVIMIIALLAALVTPAVMRARNSARNAAIRAEIDMLHMAIMNYKNEYGSFPPAVGIISGTNYAATHIKRIFPRADAAALPNAATSGSIDPSTSLLTWLGGFTDDPTDPLGAVRGSNRKRLFDADQSRTDATGLVYFPSGKKGSPYVYISSAFYDAMSAGWPAAARTYSVGGDTVPIPAGKYYVTRVPASATATPLWTNPSRPAFNPDTFQIVCAGQDEEFGTDDDLSNFWKGTRKEYLDSLK